MLLRASLPEQVGFPVLIARHKDCFCAWSETATGMKIDHPGTAGAKPETYGMGGYNETHSNLEVRL